MSPKQIRKILVEVDRLQPAVTLFHLNLEAQANVLELIEQRGMTLSSISLEGLEEVVSNYLEDRRDSQ